MASRPSWLVALAVVVALAVMMAAQAVAAAAEPEYNAHPYDPPCTHHNKHGKHGGCKHGGKPDPEPAGCMPGESAPTEVCGTELIQVGDSCATEACGNGAESQTTYTCREDGSFAISVGRCTTCTPEDASAEACGGNDPVPLGGTCATPECGEGADTRITYTCEDDGTFSAAAAPCPRCVADEVNGVQILPPCNDIAVGEDCRFADGNVCQDGVTPQFVSVSCVAENQLDVAIEDCFDFPREASAKAAKP